MKQSKPLGKFIGYFILGFISPATLFIAFIGALLWIKFKTKVFRKEKLISLVLGLVIPIVLSVIMNNTPIGDIVMNNSLSVIPELKTVNNDIKAQYPDVKVKGINYIHMTRYDSVEGKSNSDNFQYTYTSNEPYSEEKTVKIARIACNSLDSQNKPVSRVEIIYKKPFKIVFISLPFYTSYGLADSCEGWKK